MRGSAAQSLLAALTAALIGCEAPTGSSVESGDPATVVAGWVGTYEGTISGSDRSGSFAHVPIQLTISTAANIPCPEGAYVRLGDLFAQCGVSFSSPVSAAFAYDADSLRHALRLEKFSADRPGDFIIGEVAIEGPGRVDTVYFGEFNVQRR
ncbi:MAG: hypothetical protein ACE5PT_00180 [Gemmatimonadales bacterium]